MAPETRRHFLQTPELFIGSVYGGLPAGGTAGRLAGGWILYCLLVNWLGPMGEALQGEEAARLVLARLAAHAGPLDHTAGGGTGYRIDLACRAGRLSRERSPCGDSAEIPDAAGDPGYPAPPGAGRDG